MKAELKYCFIDRYIWHSIWFGSPFQDNLVTRHNHVCILQWAHINSICAIALFYNSSVWWYLIFTNYYGWINLYEYPHSSFGIKTSCWWNGIMNTGDDIMKIPIVWFHSKMIQFDVDFDLPTTCHRNTVTVRFGLG